MRKAFTLALILTILSLMAYFTKPSDEKCLAEARKEFKETKLATLTLPQNINSQLLAETLEKNFMESLAVENRFLFKEIYLHKEAKIKIGWGAFGWIHVEVR